MLNPYIVSNFIFFKKQNGVEREKDLFSLSPFCLNIIIFVAPDNRLPLLIPFSPHPHTIPQNKKVVGGARWVMVSRLRETMLSGPLAQTPK